MSAGGLVIAAGHPTLLFLLLLYWSGYGYSDAKSSSSSSSKCHSSCGSLPNISYPFRLKDSPKDCGLKRFELACENNRTILYLLAGKYYVLDIKYGDYISTIRVVDVAIDQRNCSSLLLRYSLTLANLFSDVSFESNFLYSEMVLVNCERPIKDTERNTMPYHIDLADGSNSNCFNNYPPSRRNHSYMLVENPSISDLPQMCTAEAVIPTVAGPFDDVRNLSLWDVMANGFDLGYWEWDWQCPTEGSYFHCLMEKLDIGFPFVGYGDYGGIYKNKGISFYKDKGYYSRGFKAARDCCEGEDVAS